jgi:pimeloyl-ACP methyl ester carboxylesterase
VTGLSSGVIALTAGSSHTCALTGAGGVKCWGYNYYGQLGDGTTTNRLTPINVTDLSSGVIDITAGGSHTCALTSVGGVKCWGYNYYGQLGDGTTTNRLTPMDAVGMGGGISSLGAGFYHTCALTSAGGVKCWGSNDYGQLGDGTADYRPIPGDVVDGTTGPFYTVSGGVTDANNNPIAGVTMSAGGGHTTNTDSNGNYTLGALPAGTYTLTPSKSGYTFNPASRTVSVPPDTTGKDFNGYDKPPLVFVHGWSGFPPWGSCEWPNPDTYFESVDQELRAPGYYTAYAQLETSACYTPPLLDNVPRLRNAILQAKNATNQPKVILIAHSMGGLVSRAYIEGPDYAGDVAALFTFGSPHRGISPDLLTFLVLFANGASLGYYCEHNQPAVCDFSALGMTLFNNSHSPRTTEVKYHFISGNAPYLSRNLLGKTMDVVISGILGPDDGITPTDSGLGVGLLGTFDRLETDENHNIFGPRSYFIRDGGQSISYTQCLKKVLVDKTSVNCGSFGTQQIIAQDTPNLSEHTPFSNGTVLPGQTIVRTISLEGGPTLFAAQWLTGTLSVTLIDPNGQVINPAYAASNPNIVTYSADTNVATYYFPNATSGQWQLKLQGRGLDRKNTITTRLRNGYV